MSDEELARFPDELIKELKDQGARMKFMVTYAKKPE
jgi:hypothetical protein